MTWKIQEDPEEGTTMMRAGTVTRAGPAGLGRELKERAGGRSGVRKSQEKAKGSVEGRLEASPREVAGATSITRLYWWDEGAICGGTEHGFKKLLLGTVSAGKSQHSLLIRKPINGFAHNNPKAHAGNLRLKARTLVKMCPLGASIFSSMRCR